ncbi:murein transglycosylase A [Burkholderia guangdongensis]|uniref:murein transglycosylase A n=1 Tax=Burkholderia guangdongensis TaxID=1792500 RepID=UPI001FE43BAE|nr:MltA domain-containing protein [Burkholderia guangdongensis]
MRSILLLTIATATLAGCASDNPETIVTIGPATAPAAARAAAAAPAMPETGTEAARPAPTTVARSQSAAPAMPVAQSAAAKPSAQPGATQYAATTAAVAGPTVAAATVTASPTVAAPTEATSPTVAAPTAAASPAVAAPTAAAAPVATPPSDASAPSAFSTRHAYYEATRFSDLPGWRTDDLGAAWDAFRRSCGVLGTRSGWSAPCAASRAVDARNAAAIRQFFETYFSAYQIRNVDRSTDGTLTGYYEPLLNGSQQYGGAYIYPVYGTPEDMLYLDARRVPESARGGTLAARIAGRTIVPIADAPPAVPGANGVYVLDLHDGTADVRDKKYRMRLDHGRIVPYYTRAEIERGGLKAPVLAYVDDPVMLYSMQVQGSGKIRMRDGTIRRFAYAEQNGRPFLPPVANRAGGHKLVVRGIDMDIDVTDDDPSASAAPAPSGDDASGDDAPVSPLLRGFKLAAASVGGTAGDAAPPAGGTPIRHGFATSDPSYVFFRPIPDSPNGPVGALGVPLSAGRSVAVDPRTTPLGAPVFVAAGGDPQAPGTIDRLMMAQDSGGAIRGAVRADYFYGFGQTAQTEASHTKERLRMWVLLPKGLHIAAQDATLKTRGVGGPAASNADCVVSDPDFCVDDAP